VLSDGHPRGGNIGRVARWGAGGVSTAPVFDLDEGFLGKGTGLLGCGCWRRRKNSGATAARAAGGGAWFWVYCVVWGMDKLRKRGRKINDLRIESMRALVFGRGIVFVVIGGPR